MFPFLLTILPLVVFSTSPTGQTHDELPEYHSPTVENFQLVHRTQVNATVVGVDFTVTVDGITVEFKHGTQTGTLFHNYTVHISNKSGKNVCGVKFDPNTNTTDFTNLVITTSDGLLMTKHLFLTPGANTRKFSYISSKPSRPTIRSITYCYHEWPTKSSSSISMWIILYSILLSIIHYAP